MKEVIVRLTADHIKVKGGEYVRDYEQGEWIEHKNAEEICGTLISNYECSLCHEWQTLISNFCPSCGARMRGTRDEAN